MASYKPIRSFQLVLAVVVACASADRSPYHNQYVLNQGYIRYGANGQSGYNGHPVTISFGSGGYGHIGYGGYLINRGLRYKR